MKNLRDIVVFSIVRTPMAPLIIGLIFLVIIAHKTFGAFNNGKHLAAEQCGNCHLVKQTIDAKNASVLIADQEQLCAKCHPNSLEASHPSGFKPQRLLPTNFPLDWKGELTCSTCHDIHSGMAGLPRVTEKGKPYCTACHSDKFFEGMVDQGQSIIISGHLDARNSYDALGLDSFSLQCLSCHEKMESNLGVRVSTNFITQHATGAVNHPVGKLYNDAIGYGGYKNIGTIPAQIKLPDGKVSCISCHVGYSEKHGDLVITKEGSSLCFGCHDL